MTELSRGSASGRPRLLDLFCGAGGASVGYDRAGFDVVGVDIEPQPHYPFEVWRLDAMELLNAPYLCRRMRPYDAIHASPPCQAFTAYRRRGDGVGDGYPNLIRDVRMALKATGLPYVIENVPGAPLQSPLNLCGSSFGLDVRRHRCFETSWPLMAPPCDHAWQTPRFPAATNRAKDSRCTVEVGVYRIPLDVQKRAMGIDWDVTLGELSQAIPPAYTEYIGENLRLWLRQLEGAAA